MVWVAAVTGLSTLMTLVPAVVTSTRTRGGAVAVDAGGGGSAVVVSAGAVKKRKKITCWVSVDTLNGGLIVFAVVWSWEGWWSWPHRHRHCERLELVVVVNG